MRPNVPSLEEKLIGGLFCLESKVMKSETETGLTWKMKKELTPKSTPPNWKNEIGIESHFWKEKGNQNHHLENDAN
jgi:hypothetical protein